MHIVSLAVRKNEFCILLIRREKTASTTDGMRITGEGGMKDIGAEMIGRSCQHTWLIIWSCAARESIIICPPILFLQTRSWWQWGSSSARRRIRRWIFRCSFLKSLSSKVLVECQYLHLQPMSRSTAEIEEAKPPSSSCSSHLRCHLNLLETGGVKMNKS